MGNRLKTPRKMLMMMRMYRKSPIPAWRASVGDPRRSPRSTVARVPSAAAWLAALALVTWSNRWVTPLGENRWPMPVTEPT